MKQGEPVVMVLRGSASTGPTDLDGQYLKNMNFEAFGGRGDLELTRDIDRARVFDGMAEAWAYWKRCPHSKPTRPDGQPNRPLTAMNWEFKNL